MSIGFIGDWRTLLIFCNKILKILFGYFNEELSGKNLTILLPDKFRESYLKRLEDYKISGKHRLLGKTVQTTGLRKNGTTLPFEMSFSAWKSDKTIYFSAIIRDMIERKKAEESLKKSVEKYRYIVEKFLKVSNEILQEMNKP
jgi:PAS domain S-box-containing protein